MKKKLSLATIFILLSQIIPLLVKPALIFAEANIVIMAANIAIWMTQPPVSGEEAMKNKSSDKFTVILILLVSLISIAVSIMDWAYLNNSNIANNWMAMLGMILLLFGIIFRAWSINTLGKFFTATVQIKDNHHLITKGPYSIVRHPSYLGAWTAIMGAGLYLNSIAGFIVAFVGMLFAYYFRIKVEEDALIRSFGNEYKNYQMRVKRIIPFIW